MVKYLKIGKATELTGRDRFFYRAIEIAVGSMSWLTLIALVVLSCLKPVWIAYFVILFDVYWLLLVLYLAIHLIIAFSRIQRNKKIDWMGKCRDLADGKVEDLPDDCLTKKGYKYSDIIHYILMPTYSEPAEVIAPSIQSLIDDGFSTKSMIFNLGLEAREGEKAIIKGEKLKKQFGKYFRNFVITVHPDKAGELKGKGANQAHMAAEVKKILIDKEKLPYEKIIVSVFDCDTVVVPGYFATLTYRFLTVSNPYHASYQPVPLYHNNIWDVPFFSRVAASSNTFWQMMQQIRVEKLATYSSHSMPFRTLVEVDFWSTTMVSEDSRIYWHCYLHFLGDYRVEPLYFPILMDSIKVKGNWKTFVGLYRQQQRWGWGIENVPYMIFNTVRLWDKIPKRRTMDKIFVQLHGFHSWATNALIIAVIGWMPLILGGDVFNDTVLSGNLPNVTRFLMTLAMSGLVLSSVIATILLPKRPKKYHPFRHVAMLLEWILLPVGIVLFGSLPALDSQTHMLFGKYLGFIVTPKERDD